MKKYTIEIYNDSTVRRMQEIKDTTGKTFADQMREGLRMLFAKIDRQKAEEAAKTETQS